MSQSADNNMIAAGGNSAGAVADASAGYIANFASEGLNPVPGGMVCPPGYKQTEVGVIPEDWEVFSLPDVIWYQEGPGLRKWQFKSKGLKVINVTNLQENGFLDLDRTDRHISWDEYEKTYQHFSCDEGDLVIASSGNSYCKASIVRSCDLPLLMNTSVIRFKPIGEFSKGYMEVYLKSPYFKDQIDLLITGGAQPNFGPAHLNLIKIPAPIIQKEQTAIANALSDVDALISELGKLIAKKQAIKTATMQQLLTGRTRLPQFAMREDGSKKGTKPSELGEIPEDWEVVNIGELGQVDPENLGSTTSPDYEFNYVSLEQVEKGVLLCTTGVVFRNAPSRARRVLKKGDVLVSTVRPNLMSHYFVRNEVNDLICSTGFSVIRFFEEKFFPEYLYQHLFSSVINNQIEMLISGSNYPAINSGDVKQLKIQIGSAEEQTAIATILSDMDAELQALEQRLSKTRQIKQGMMQELLTGKTRLVQPLNKESQHG
jgi:type I restriction enzyme, S subunit